MSLISTLRKGRKGFPQKGQVVFRLESSAVQPAMISSSYTRQSHVLQREQLEISSWKHTHTHTHSTYVCDSMSSFYCLSELWEPKSVNSCTHIFCRGRKFMISLQSSLSLLKVMTAVSKTLKYHQRIPSCWHMSISQQPQSDKWRPGKISQL